MKKRNILICILLLFVCSNCTSFNNLQDVITIVYCNGDFDNTINISCDELNKISKRIDIDTTIIISQDEFEKIATFIKKNYVTDIKQDCDARMILEHDSCKICIGSLNDICSKKDICEDLNIIYLMKCRSGFYNYWSKDDMLFDICIEKFGIPKDYHFITPDLFNLKFLTKVVIYKDSNKRRI